MRELIAIFVYQSSFEKFNKFIVNNYSSKDNLINQSKIEQSKTT